jgi:O-antigen ligase
MPVCSGVSAVESARVADMIRHSGLVLTAFLVLAVALAPLPFGAVTSWAESLLRALCFVALAVAAVAAETLSSWRPAALAGAVLAAFALLGLLQSAPLPARLVAVLAPEHAALQRQAAELAAGRGVTPRLTLAAAATRSAALGWAAAAAAFLAAAVAGRRRKQRRALAGALLAGALFQTVFGARQWIARANSLWGVELRGAATSARLRGTFVNPNHLALYFEMALPVAFAWIWWAARRARDTASVERRLLLLAAPVLIWLLVFAGLSLTGSRAGLLAAMSAVTVQGALVARSRRRWWLAPLGALMALGALALVTTVGMKEGMNRLAATSTTDVSLGGRLEEYRAALRLWTRFPLTGSGLGTFRDGFPLVQTPSLQGTWWHPHSDFLEVLVTAGIVGAALLAVGLWAVVRQSARVLRAGSRSEDRAAGLAACGLLVSMAIHESLDFGLAMPANAVTLAVLLGAVTAAKLSSASAQGDRAGNHLTLLPVDDLQDVEAGAERHRQLQRRRDFPRRHREGAETGAVQP